MEYSSTSTKSSTRIVGAIIVVGLLVGAGLGLLVFRGNPAATPAAVQPVAPADAVAGLGVGNVPPDFTLSDAVTGEEVSLYGLRGQPVLVNFWATWCGPCRLEMPAIEAAFQQHQADGFAVLAVDFDEPAPAVVAFGEELGLTFNLLLDPGGKVQDLYRIRAYPSSYFIAPDGAIAGVHLGVMTEGQLADNLALILP